MTYFCSPPDYATQTSKVPQLERRRSDRVLGQMVVLVIEITFIADQRAVELPNRRNCSMETAEVPAPYNRPISIGICDNRALWAYSRHRPNFAAEQTVWVGMYQWSCFLTGSLYTGLAWERLHT